MKNSNLKRIRKRGGILFGDPIPWTREVVGSPFRFWLIISIHVMIGVLLIGSRGIEMVPCVLFATFFPILYLHAMKLLLEEIDEIKQDT